MFYILKLSFLGESLELPLFVALSEQNVNFSIAVTISAICIEFESSSPSVNVLQLASESTGYGHEAATHSKVGI
jgi:hypothetical protein